MNKEMKNEVKIGKKFVWNDEEWEIVEINKGVVWVSSLEHKNMRMGYLKVCELLEKEWKLIEKRKKTIGTTKVKTFNYITSNGVNTGIKYQRFLGDYDEFLEQRKDILSKFEYWMKTGIELELEEWEMQSMMYNKCLN